MLPTPAGPVGPVAPVTPTNEFPVKSFTSFVLICAINAERHAKFEEPKSYTSLETGIRLCAITDKFAAPALPVAP